MIKIFTKFGFQLPLVLLVVLFQFSASAAIQTFTSESTFTSSLQAGYYLENFNAVPDNQTAFSGGAPAFSYTITATSGTYLVGDLDLDARAMSTFSPNDVLVVTFGTIKPTAIGGNFYWTDGGGNTFAGSVRVQYGGSSEFFDVPLPLGGSFAGITTDNPLGFSALSISMISYPGGDRYPTMDNFYVGNVTPVPEPGGWIAAGFVGLVVLGRNGWGMLRRKIVRQ